MKTSIPFSVKTAIDISNKCEFSGCYEEGLQVFQNLDFWDYEKPDVPPIIGDYSPKEFASMVLRCGVLHGMNAGSRQEVVKDLLSIAEGVFAEHSMPAQQAICFNYMAILCYRTGEPNEARTYVDQAISLYNKGNIFLQSMLAQSFISFMVSDYRQNLERLASMRTDFERSTDYFRAIYHEHLGLLKKNLGEPGAFGDLDKARNLYEKLGHRIYLAGAENNIARYWQAKGNPYQASYHAGLGLDLSIESGRLRYIAHAEDTLASIAIDMEQYEIAIKYSSSAVNRLQGSDAHKLLADAMITKIEALHRLHRTMEALSLFADAMPIFALYTNAEVIQNVLGKVADIFTIKLKARTVIVKNDRRQQITVPLPDTKDVNQLSVVTLPNDDLRQKGLRKDDMLLLRDAHKPKRSNVEEHICETGDLIMIECGDGNELVGIAEFKLDVLTLNVSRYKSYIFFDDQYEIIGKAISYYREINDELVRTDI